MNLRICTYGNPILRRKAKEIGIVDEKIRKLAKKMMATMHEKQGIGLAAEQIGRTERMFVIDIPPKADTDGAGKWENQGIGMPLVCINPKITGHAEKICTRTEGCLSFPGIFVNVARWSEVDTEYIDINGHPQVLHASGLLARAFQHELDHLDGILFIDRISYVKRVVLRGKLKRLAKQTKPAL